MTNIFNSLVSTIRNLNDKFSQNPKYTMFLPKNSDRNSRLCNLESESHLFVIACLMDRQISAERAWNLPFDLENRIDHFTMQTLSETDLPYLENAMQNPSPLHRYWQQQAKNLSNMSKKIVQQYAGQPNISWSSQSWP